MQAIENEFDLTDAVLGTDFEAPHPLPTSLPHGEIQRAFKADFDNRPVQDVIAEPGGQEKVQEWAIKMRRSGRFRPPPK
jgi:hypothetical protein